MLGITRSPLPRTSTLALLATAALALACQDIEVAMNNGTGGDGNADVRPDGGGPSDVAVTRDGDGGGPQPDTVGPRDTDPPPDGAGPMDQVGPPDQVDPPDTGRDVVSPPDAPVDTDPGPVDAGDGETAGGCVDDLLDPAWGDGLVTPFTLEGEDDFAGSCGGAGSKDFAYGWVVPFTEWFTLDTAGSDFDTVLYVLDGCDGPELACNNDASDTDATSRVVRRFRADDRHVVVIDGNSGSRGNAVLDIQPVTCPSADVGGGAGLPQDFTTATGTAELGGACGGDTGPERTFRFTPPEPGLWRVSAKPDPAGALDPALTLVRGPTCDGPVLQCNGHDSGRIGMPASVTRALPGGEPVTIIVDSRRGQGGFALGVEKLDEACPAHEFDALARDTGFDLREQTDLMTTSCGQNADVEFGAFSAYPDVVLGLDDIEPGGSTFCQLEVRAGFPFSMALLRGECSGPEVVCDTRGELGTDERYRLTTNLPKLGGRLTLVVSPIIPEWGGWIDSMVHVAIYCVA